MKAYRCQKIYGEDGIYTNANLLVKDGKFQGISEHVNYAAVDVIEYEDAIIIPGIIDIHSHGRLGYSATCKDMDELYGYTKAVAASGVTGVFATTQEFETMGRVADAINRNEVHGARLLGIQAEGPYRHPKYMGASKGFDWPKPSLAYTQKMWKAAKGHLRYMSISTDIEGLDDSIAFLKEKGVILAAGHTDAGYHQMKEGIRKGISTISHFGNAMRQIHQRDGGAVGACLLDSNLLCEIICDHVHIAPEVLDIYFKIKDRSQFLLVSDSSELAGMPKGRYYARGKERLVTEDGRIVLDDGTISGSGKTILYGIKNLIRSHDFTMEECLSMCSYQPAKLFGLQDHKGSIAQGKDADFVVLNQDLEVLATYVEGKKVYDCNIDTDLVNPQMLNLEQH